MTYHYNSIQTKKLQRKGNLPTICPLTLTFTLGKAEVAVGFK